MKFQQIFESLGILVSGVLFYSYTYSWFPPGHPQRQRWWTAVLGLSFGGLAIAMMIARIEIAPGVFIDARLVPVALIGLFEGWKIGLLAGLVGAAFRVSLGEPGMWASVAGLALMGLGAGLVQRWAGGADQVGPRHAFAVTVIALSITSSGLAALGTEGMSAFSRVWISYLAMLVAGIAFLAKLFHDVVIEHQLAAQQQRFRAILDEAGDAIRIVDADTLVIVECNRARREAAMAEARATGVARTLGAPLRTASGHTLIVDSTRCIVHYQGRRYEIIIYRDAGERLKAEAAMREATELRSINLLAQAASHEINNPLAVIVGYLQLMNDRAAASSQEGRWLGMCIEASDRIKDAVARLRRIVRVEVTQPSCSTPPILDTEKSSQPADE